MLHDFFTQFGRTKIFVKKMHEGYGLVCHRAIKACCEAIGIKDIYAKVEGPTNLQHIVKAFFIGLLRQVCICQMIHNVYFFLNIFILYRHEKNIYKYIFLLSLLKIKVLIFMMCNKME